MLHYSLSGVQTSRWDIRLSIEQYMKRLLYENNIHKTLVEMAVSLESVNSKKLRLMEILSDGKVDDAEISDLNKILEELEKISMTIEAIQLWCEKMKLLGDK